MPEVNRRNTLRIIVTNSALFAFLYGSIYLNKKIFRSELSDASFLSILTGSFPNFIAAYIISFAFVNAVLIKRPQNSRLIVYAGSLLVFTALTIEEMVPVWGGSVIFDALDIFASGLGSVLSIITFELVVRNAR